MVPFQRASIEHIRRELRNVRVQQFTDRSGLRLKLLQARRLRPSMKLKGCVADAA